MLEPRTAHSVAFLVLVLALVFWSTSATTPYPSVEVADAELRFNGQRAFSELEALLDVAPSRVAGASGGQASADWVSQEFSALGLDVHTEDFDFVSPFLLPHRSFGDLLGSSVDELGLRGYGTNVVAVSPGDENDIIVIGAHRDTVANAPGAEDNSSGTAVILELARVVSRQAHRYTYMFMSFDAEEAGLLGSKAFVREHGSDPLRFALVLDMAG